jgi:hypothetical protein
MKQVPRSRSTARSLLRKIAPLVAGISVSASLPLTAHGTEHEFTTTITRLYSYSEGSVVVQTAALPSQCTAFWLDKTATGFKSSYALLLSAYHTQSLVRFVADDAVLWSGSGTPHCRIAVTALD